MNLSAADRRRRFFIALLGCVTLANVGLCTLLRWQAAAPGQASTAIRHLAAAPPDVQPARDDEKRPLQEEAEPPFRLTSDQKKPTLDVQENFDKATPGKMPDGWAQWSSTKLPSFAVVNVKSLSAPNGLASAGATNTVARAWLDKLAVADAQVSAAILLDTLAPAEVFVRGGGLDGGSPTYYAAAVTRGMEVQLVKVVKGTPTVLGSLKSAGYFSSKWARVTLRAEGNDLKVQVFGLDAKQYLDENGQWVATPAWALKATDKDIASGLVGLGRQAKVSGTITFDDFVAGPPAADETPPAPPAAAANPTPKPADTTKPATPPAQPPATPALPTPVAAPVPIPKVPRHYEHIRIAMLAYSGNPMGSFEDKLLKESVDVVVPNASYLEHIHQVAPDTPQLVYTNTSNLYSELYVDWLNFADSKGLNREEAFYHAAVAKPFRGDSPSSMPVTWFWGVHRGSANLTSAAHAKDGKVAFGAAGESLYLGHPDRFREINLTLTVGAKSPWSAALEYATAVDKAGQPTNWAALKTVTDTTNKLSKTGQVTFDPPADWKPCVVNGSARLYYVRFRAGAGGAPPEAANILGRDYVGANGTTAGTVPAFDAKADANGDGYLDDAEYAKRAEGKDARFIHESRMLTESYGQMRFLSNPSGAGFRDWCVDYHQRLLTKYPLAGGFFMDNSGGKVPVRPADVLEAVNNYSNDCGLALNAIAKAIQPKWILPNTVGGGAAAEPIIKQNPAYFEEFCLRPMSHAWPTVEDMAAQISRRQALTTPAPLGVIDSHPQKGSVTDGRMMLGVLAYYYLMGDPDSTFLMFFGGYEPGNTWQRHWTAAAAYNVGKPKGAWSQWATGADPANAALTYKVYAREYDNALVLFKPLSYGRGAKDPAGLGDETATKHDLNGSYKPLQADGTLGAAVTSVSLRNGEGAILIKGK